MIAILCIVDGARADDVVDIVLSVVSDRIGLVAISDAYVVIPEHFRGLAGLVPNTTFCRE